jgi:hypothetical protein
MSEARGDARSELKGVQNPSSENPDLRPSATPLQDFASNERTLHSERRAKGNTMDFRRKFHLSLFGVALATSVLTTGCQQAPNNEPAQAQPAQNETVVYNKWEVETHRAHKDISQRPPAEQKEYHDWRQQHPDHP